MWISLWGWGWGRRRRGKTIETHRTEGDYYRSLGAAMRLLNTGGRRGRGGVNDTLSTMSVRSWLGV